VKVVRGLREGAAGARRRGGCGCHTAIWRRGSDYFPVTPVEPSQPSQPSQPPSAAALAAFAGAQRDRQRRRPPQPKTARPGIYIRSYFHSGAPLRASRDLQKTAVALVAEALARSTFRREGRMMKRPPLLSPEAAAAAREAYSAGSTALELATALGVSLRTIQRALAATPRTSPAAPPPASHDDDAFEALPEGWDAEDYVRQSAEDARRSAHAARASGDLRAAGRYARDAAGLASVLARLERQRADTREVVTFTRQELEDGARLVQERLKALEADRIANGGFVCVKCGEALRMADAETHAAETRH
jgi:hypothetical protein